LVNASPQQGSKIWSYFMYVPLVAPGVAPVPMSTVSSCCGARRAPGPMPPPGDVVVLV
jgi:hypothetical protein